MARRLRDQTIGEEMNTECANDFARGTYHSPREIRVHWWSLFSNYRLKKWKQELKGLSEKTGMSVNDVCSYMGSNYSGLPHFYRKLPKSKETYIGIGMAYRLSLHTINRWLIKYGGKKKLYIKDLLNDMIWIYLIHANENAQDETVNYYQKFEECRDCVKEIYRKMNTEIEYEEVLTVELDKDAEKIIFDPEYLQLKAFVRENLEAFRSAYAKPKIYLNRYIDQILEVKNKHKIGGRDWTLNSLRGYLDDSMINYLTSGAKYVPKNKKTHIAIGLAVGMTTDELNEYLQMLGYAELDGTYLEEGILINVLENWDEDHLLQRKFKEKYLEGKSGIYLKPREELQAVNDMLGLRRDLKEAYEQAAALEPGSKEKTKKFPYMND